MELDAACAQVARTRLVLALEADIAQQAGQQGHVQVVVGGRRLIQSPALLLDDGQQLRMHVAPFAQAHLRQEIRAAIVLQLAVGFLVLDGGLEPAPDFQVTQEFRFLIGEFLVRLVGRLLVLHRAVARVLHGQGRGDDQHFRQTRVIERGEDHAAHARVQRQLGQLVAQRRKLVHFIDGTEFLQQLITVGHRARQRRLDEGEGFHVRQVQRFHAQDDGRQRGAQDFRFREFRAQQIILLFVQADADAIGHAAATSGALVGGRLGDRLDLQLLHLVPITVTFHARQASIDHVADAGHGQRGFRHVGGQHDAARIAGFKHALLLLGRQAREQGQDFHMRRMVLAQRFGAVADFALARQEYQHVARADAAQLFHAIDDGVHQVALFARGSRSLAGLVRVRGTRHGHLLPFHGAVAHFHLVQAARHFDHGRGFFRRAEMAREALGIDGGRGDDDLQIGPARQQLL